MRKKFQAIVNGFHIDSDYGVAHKKAGIIKLQAKEIAVLVELVRNAGVLLSKEELIDSVWGEQSGSYSSLARSISRVKSSLEKAERNAGSLIKSVYGKGYVFAGKVTKCDHVTYEEHFQALIDTSPDFIAVKDGRGRWLAFNDVGIRLYQLAGVNWLGKTNAEMSDLCPPQYRAVFEACARTDEIAWDTRQPARSSEVVELSDGSKRYIEVVKTPLFHKDGSRKSLMILGHDITELIQLREMCKAANQAPADDHDVIVVTNSENRIVSVNRAFTQVTGYTEDEVIGKNPNMLASGRHDRAFYQAMWHQIQAEGGWRGEIWDRRKNGEIHSKWLEIRAVYDAAGNLANYFATFSSSAKQKEIEEKIQEISQPIRRVA